MKDMNIWENKRVFITGHTGFKGAWLSLYLEKMGAQIVGYSLPPRNHSLYEQARLKGRWEESFADVRDYESIQKEMSLAQPSIVIHLAAQPLVLDSYMNPMETYSTNVMGTVNLLEAVRSCRSVKAVLVVTTDKVYQNIDDIWSYRETDPLGGNDPYSSSKACAELVASAYRDSFFNKEHSPLVATARAGNVIGGGDWADNRLIPDAVKAFSEGKTLKIRHPHAVRPWQFVLEPLRGYIHLVEKLMDGDRRFASCWNFAPPTTNLCTVSDVVGLAAHAWGNGAKWELDTDIKFSETKHLSIDSTKSITMLGWNSKIDIKNTIEYTISWYRNVRNGRSPLDVTLEQIGRYLDCIY